jgi:alpha-beta hydrolase superfamily lysophospholipase
MEKLDIDAVRRSMHRLDLAVYSPLHGAAADYAHFYGIDMENTLAGVRHHFGYVDAHGYRLAAHVFVPAGPRGTVFILHGYLDHSGLYRHLIRDCLERQFAVFIFDLPGHGLSTGARADIPDFSHYQHVLDDMLEKFSPELPQPFLAIGQSTGGAILMDHVLTAVAQGTRPAFSRILLLAPLLRPAQWLQIRFGLWLIRRFRSSVPRVFRRNSGDEDFLRFLSEADPLQDRQVPMGWIVALKRWVEYMQQMPASDFPALLVQGERDETVDWRYNTRFVRRHFRVVQDVSLPAASHQLANERDDLRVPVHEAVARLLAD